MLDRTEFARGLERQREEPGQGDTITTIVIGAGIGGIAAGVALQGAGLGDFRIIEQSAGIGGTWWDNDYPGAEVDSHSRLYEYSFQRYNWSRTHAQQPEILKYLSEVVDEAGIRDRIILNAKVVEAVWNDDRQQYRVQLSTGETLYANVLVSAVGQLNNPRYPEWPGLDEFRGAAFHTARWDSTCDLEGKRIAVVGTGSTACQVVPELAKVAGRLFVFQREPGYIFPKDDRDYTAEEMAAFERSSRFEVWREWWNHFWGIQRGMSFGRQYRTNTRLNAKNEQLCLAYIDHAFADRPDLKELVTPRYPFAGKRTILNKDFYPALKLDNVELVPRAVSSVTENGLVDVSGVETPIDVLVMATGFQPANFLATVRVVGRHGRSLQEVWKDEPSAFLGLSVPTFPNFYMMYGPNTNGGDIFVNHKVQASAVVRSMRRMQRTGATAIEVRRSAVALFNKWLRWQMRNTAWHATSNYYKSPSGAIVTQWPVDAISYALMAQVLGGIAFRRTTAPRRGRGWR